MDERKRKCNYVNVPTKNLFTQKTLWTWIQYIFSHAITESIGSSFEFSRKIEANVAGAFE